MGKHKKKTAVTTCSSELSGLIEKLMTLTLKDVKYELPRDALENFASLRNIIEEIRPLEKPFDEVPHRDEELLQQMIDWGIRFGCYVRSITIKKLDDEENYGVFCTDSLQDSDIFLSVPLDLMMTSDFSLEKTQLGPLLKEDPICSKMSNVCLSLFLLNELAKGEEGFWHFYIRCLPSQYCTILYFNEDDMKFLSGSTVLDDACRMYRSIARQYAYFKRKFLYDSKWKKQAAAKLFTFDSYRWACSTVMTRQNELPSLTPGRMQMALVPLWDMCNHDSLKSGTDYDVASQQLVSFATRTYTKNEQVNIFYGNRANAQFMLHNGFVPDENQWDSLSLKIGLSKADKLYEMKRRLCEQVKIPTSDVFELKKAPDGDGVLVPKVLLHLVHILQWKAPTVSDDSSADVDGNASDASDPVRTEKAKTFLHTRCSLLIKALPKSVEELTAILNSPQTSPETKLAIRFRLSEHKMLANACNKILFTM